LIDETVRRVGGRRPLMVGDRLDTDIEGAHNAQVDSLLVMTGVTGLAELVSASTEHRPTYLSADLGGLLTPHPTPAADGAGWAVGGWLASVRDGRLDVAGAGSIDDWWRVVAVAGWAHRDATGTVADITALRIPDAAGVGR
jgi:hypothetical protein